MSTEARVTNLEQAMADLARSQAQMIATLDRFVAEVRASNQTNDEHNRAADKRQANTTANLDRLTAELRASSRAAEEGRRAAEESLRALEESGRAADKRWGELANKMGTMAEDIVAPGIPEVFHRLYGHADPDWYVRVRRRHRADPSRRVEFDVVAWAAGYFLAVEVRSGAKPEDVPALVARFAEVRDFFPEAEGHKVVGALASFYVDASIVRAAEREGLLVFGLGSGLLELLSKPGFQPREF